MRKKYELEIMIKPKIKILDFKQVDVDFCNTSLYRSTPDYKSYLFYGSTKRVCINRATSCFYKEIMGKEKEFNKLKQTYCKLIDMLYEEEQKIND